MHLTIYGSGTTIVAKLQHLDPDTEVFEYRNMLYIKKIAKFMGF